MRRTLALVAVLAATAPATAGPCAMPPLTFEVATPKGTTIDQHGGIGAAAVADVFGSAGPPSPADGERQFRAGHLDVKASPEVLAPGLVVYRIPPALRRDLASLAFVDAAGTSLVTVAMRMRKDRPADRAPQIKRITASPSNPRRSSSWVTATLKQAPPTGTIAVIVRDAKAKDAAARSFERIADPGATELTVYSGDRCTPRAPGTAATASGHEIQLAWVSAAGHVSRWSAPIVVRSSRGPAQP